MNRNIKIFGIWLCCIFCAILFSISLYLRGFRLWDLPIYATLISMSLILLYHSLSE